MSAIIQSKYRCSDFSLVYKYFFYTIRLNFLPYSLLTSMLVTKNANRLTFNCKNWNNLLIGCRIAIEFCVVTSFKDFSQDERSRMMVENMDKFRSKRPKIKVNKKKDNLNFDKTINFHQTCDVVQLMQIQFQIDPKDKCQQLHKILQQ